MSVRGHSGIVTEQRMFTLPSAVTHGSPGQNAGLSGLEAGTGACTVAQQMNLDVEFSICGIMTGQFFISE